MHPIDELLEQYADFTADAVRLVETQPDVRLTSRPSPIRWSAVECLQHLTISAHQFYERLEPAVEQARALPAAQGPFKVNFTARLLMWVVEPPARLRFPTPPAFVPAAPQTPAEALRDFQEAHEKIASLLDGARGLPLDRVAIVSPFAENVRYNAWSAFLLVAVHVRRHLWQARRAVAV